MIPTRCGVCKSAEGIILWCEEHIQPEHAICHIRLLKKEKKYRKLKKVL